MADGMLAYDALTDRLAETVGRRTSSGSHEPETYQAFTAQAAP
jgi:hypothetical protein